MIGNPYWLTISATGGLPVLFLPETRREVVLLLSEYLRQGEVVLQSGQLQELQGALALLQVSLGGQVNWTTGTNLYNLGYHYTESGRGGQLG